MSNLIKVNILILDSNHVAIKNINVRTKYVNGTSFYDDRTNNLGHRIVTVSNNREFEIYVENPQGSMEFCQKLKANINNLNKVIIKYPISAYLNKSDNILNKLTIKLIDSNNNKLSNFPVRTNYKDSLKFAERTTNENGILEFKASKDRIIEIKSLDIDDNFILLGYFSSNETRVIIVKHKLDIQKFLSKTTVKVVDIVGKNIYPNARIKIKYNNKFGIIIVKDGVFPITTYVGYPIEFTVYKPDNTPLEPKTYIASRVKPKSGFEIRVPVNITNGKTDTNKPDQVQDAPSGINDFISSCIQLYEGIQLTEDDYVNAAKKLTCEVAAIKAVADIESSARGAFQTYLGKKVPTILFERHYFRKYTNRKYDNTHNLISGPYDPSKYGKYNAQYPKLMEAIGLDENAALKSCSWGKFQIMGANHIAAGHTSVKDMVQNAFKSEKEHLKQFVNFVLADGRLLHAIQNKKWANFAKIYNGSGYADNKYDVKMENSYNNFSKNKEMLP